MKTLSNLPPGVTDYDIEEQAGGIDLLSANERQTLGMILPHLKYGMKSHCQDLLDNHDPTGGMVGIDDQVWMLYQQYVAAVNEANHE